MSTKDEDREALQNKRAEKIHEILYPLTRADFELKLKHSPFYIATQLEMELDDLLNTIMDDISNLKLYWNIYLAKYKGLVLDWAYANKQNLFVEKLLVESNIINAAEKGNDLELLFNIGEIKI